MPALLVGLVLAAACDGSDGDEPDNSFTGAPGFVTGDAQAGHADGGAVYDAGFATDAASFPGMSDAAQTWDAGPVGVLDAGSPGDAARDTGAPSEADAAADTGLPPAIDSGSEADAEAEGDGSVGSGEICELPKTFNWTGGGPLAQPKNGAVSMKDVTHVFYQNQHILYFTTFSSSWGAAMMTFKDWPDAASAPQNKLSFGVAPTLFYFSPKKLWVIAYQWGPHKFSYRTSTDPTNPNGWSGEKSLYNTALPSGGTGPIDQTVICDDAKCYLYYAGDNGHIYKSSMPIASFPGEFPAGKDSGIVGTAQNLFEAVQVYTLKGSKTYLMIVEAQGSGRYFRAFTATSLDGPWTLLSNDFAVKKNVSLSPDWTNDISHGDLVRENPDETFTVDPCKLQMVFQGRDPRMNTSYDRLPYRLGLITLQR